MDANVRKSQIAVIAKNLELGEEMASFSTSPSVTLYWHLNTPRKSQGCSMWAICFLPQESVYHLIVGVLARAGVRCALQNSSRHRDPKLEA